MKIKINKIVNFLLYFVAFQIVLGLLFGTFVYGDCVIYRDNYVHNQVEDSEWAQYVSAQFGCYPTFGVPSPIFYIKPEIQGFIVHSLVINILIFSLLVLVIKKLKKQMKGTVSGYVKVFLQNIFFIYLSLYFASFILQLLLRITGFYEHYVGGPVIFYDFGNFFQYMIIPFSFIFYYLSTYVFFLPFQALISVIMVNFLSKQSSTMNQKERIFYFVFFMFLTMLLLNFTAYITHGVVDIHCFHNSSDCDG